MNGSKLVFPVWMIFNFEKNVLSSSFTTFFLTFPQVPDSKLIL